MAKRRGGNPPAGSRGSRRYVPDAGQLIWLSFSPQAGREQSGQRPALVLSPRSYNSRAGLCLVCPITTHVKNYPFEVLLPAGLAVAGVVLSDHIKSTDWESRKAECAGSAPSDVLAEVRAKLRPLLGI
jgi:mRNA interferase MazF